jgi:two-component system sensor histidine kinase UhpB
MGVATDMRGPRTAESLAAEGSGAHAGRSGTRTVSLFWRIFSLNAVGLIAAAALLLGPVTVSSPVPPGEALAVVGGLAALLAANALVLRVGLAPCSDSVVPWPPPTCGAPEPGPGSPAPRRRPS